MTSGSKGFSKGAGAILAALWLVLTINLFITVALYQVNVMAWDQWGFYAPLFRGSGWWGIFDYQHGPHRQGLGFVITSWILKATSWDTRWDSLWIASLFSISAALGLRLKWKMTARRSICDGCIPLLALGLTQFETILVTPNSSHSAFPLALLLLAANVWLSDNYPARYLFAGAASVFLTFTGFGIFGAAMLGGLLLGSLARHAMERETGPAIWAGSGLVIAAAGWLAFAHNYVFDPAVAGFRFPWTPLADYARFIALMLLEPAGVSGATTAHYVVGGLLALAVAAIVFALSIRWISWRQMDKKQDVLILLLGTGVLYVGSTAVGRVCLGVTAGMSSRYVSLMLPLWIGLYIAGSLDGRRALAVLGTVAAWGIALWPYRDLAARPVHRWPGTLGFTTEGLHYIQYSMTRKAEWVSAYLATGSWQQAQEAYGEIIYPVPPAIHLQDKLDFLRCRRLSFFAGDTPSSYLPWLLQDRVVWNDEFSARNTHRPLSGKEKLTFLSRRGGILEIQVTRYGPRPSPAILRCEHDGVIQPVTVTSDSARLALAVRPGITQLTFSSSEPSSNADERTLTLGPVRLEEDMPSDAIILR